MTQSNKSKTILDMNMGEILKFLGVKSVREIFTSFMESEKLKVIMMDHFDELLKTIANGNYPKEADMVDLYSSYDDRS